MSPETMPLVLGVALVLLLLLLVVLLQLRQFFREAGAGRRNLLALEAIAERVERLLRQEIAANREETALSQRRAREELAVSLRGMHDSLQQRLVGQQGLQEGKFEALRTTLAEQISGLQQETARQLERIRATVDEQLQGTLERRLGESFRQVSERLEMVARGLGEMQGLAAGLGDLKKILGNVKSRGTWGEVQLGVLLEQVLAPEQYAANVSTRNRGERVEFAVKLPGRSPERDEVVWLPIDAKFPLEDYQRLLEAQEQGDAAAAELAGRQLEQRIRSCARDIRDKYLDPPATTDFAILFLPTEGLFAEVLRRPGLGDTVQRECKVVIAGPTTLWALLNSLQLGFRTLAIERRSAEVWQLLAAVKTEWSRYGDILGRIQQKLHEASNSLDQAQTRSRVIGRRLGAVQQLSAEQARPLLDLPEPAAPEGDARDPAATR
ncbi:MAG: recombinase RmuC [Desulfobulbaceae bacterium A2]|nr:MAG: recombinase RmuC [Desulfobulbaceae bacterium A2]